MFGIVPSHELEKQTAPTERVTMEQIADLRHLHKKLDDQPLLKGKYILLPNVNDGGTSTFLRNGAHEHYKKMPCVGGYVDGALSISTGWLNKLAGGDVNYGNKGISVISTSDNRCEDGRNFGQHFTWIKWAQPSAEALRQACLAKESRISQETPIVPQITITKVDVTNSKFLGSFAIEFNKQYNALIGGRGTGKSTILEYIRWGLCDQTIGSTDPEELSELERRRKRLIDRTLADFEGEVRITFSLNGVNHIVKRNSITKETLLKIADAEFQQVTEEEVRKILPIQAYSQKQLSSVGVLTDELKRFIQVPIITELTNYDSQLTDITNQTQTEYINLVRKKELQKEIDQFNLEISSLNGQGQNLRRTLSGISEEQQGIIARKPIYDNEAALISNIQRELNSTQIKINELDQSLQSYPEAYPAGMQLENIEIFQILDTARRQKFAEIKSLIAQLKESLLPENSSEVRTKIREIQELRIAFDLSYETAKSTTTSNQQQLSEIQRIETRLAQLRESVDERLARLREIEDPEELFNTLRASYWRVHRDKVAIITEEANKFSGLSKGLIRVDVENNLDLVMIKAQLSKSLQGTRISTDKIQAIGAAISGSADPLYEWEVILNELRLLSEIVQFEDVAAITLPQTPKLVDIGMNENNLRKIIDILNPEEWLNLAVMSLEYAPEFHYTTNTEMEDVIPFSEASAGQQATALLTVLLNQPGTPLLIDQPEDDIDNRAIDDIIKSIWDAKKHRQLVFTSHNANLVVNGDAELVVCCDYRDSGSQTRGIIKAEGAIDSKIVKDEITAVMEGGEKAFKLRKDKYGF